MFKLLFYIYNYYYTYGIKIIMKLFLKQNLSVKLLWVFFPNRYQILVYELYIIIWGIYIINLVIECCSVV